MEYLEIIKEFGIWGLLTAVLLTIYLLIIKLLINTLFAKDYKKFEQLHSKRLDVVDNTYKKLVSVEKTITHLVSFAGETDGKPASKEELQKREDRKLDKFSDTLIDFMDYANYNQLYFNSKIVNAIEDIKSYCLTKSINFVFRDKDGNRPISFDERVALQNEVSKKLPKLRTDIEKLFKKIIGE